MKKLEKNIISLVNLSGAPGNEGEVLREIEKLISGKCDSCATDSIGNLIAVITPLKKRGEREKIMFCAHTDEAGFMVKDIDNEGKCSIAFLGIPGAEVLSSRRVTISGKEEKITGVASCKPIHMQSRDERGKAVPADKVYIDTGCLTKDEALKYFAPGDFGTFDSKVTYLNKSRICGKALDSRACVAALIEIINGIDRKTLKNELYFVFTSRSKIGLLGARVAAQRIMPDKAIVLEGIESTDLSGAEDWQKTCIVGKGAVISYIDGGTVYNRGLVDEAIKHAEDNKIPYQIKRNAAGYGESVIIHKSVGGIKTVTVSLPVRYMNTANEITDINDVEAMTAIAARYAE